MRTRSCVELASRKAKRSLKQSMSHSTSEADRGRVQGAPPRRLKTKRSELEHEHASSKGRRVTVSCPCHPCLCPCRPCLSRCGSATPLGSDPHSRRGVDPGDRPLDLGLLEAALPEHSQHRGSGSDEDSGSSSRQLGPLGEQPRRYESPDGGHPEAVKETSSSLHCRSGEPRLPGAVEAWVELALLRRLRRSLEEVARPRPRSELVRPARLCLEEGRPDGVELVRLAALDGPGLWLRSEAAAARELERRRLGLLVERRVQAGDLLGLGWPGLLPEPPALPVMTRDGEPASPAEVEAGSADLAL